MKNFRQTKEAWTNDYLDLYLHAKNTGDEKWQEEILEKLYLADQFVIKELEEQHEQKLWKRFDQINEQLLAIYGQLRQQLDRYEKEKLQEKAIELKNQRIDISQKITSAKGSFTN
ncbi:hypothetical protein [Metabacillus sp. RGM 3146]|uniref:hypothetical protein n=1 Tax=Metabacillus sp. RGM 3146 TaxID=3401092 RepID=UPI003B9C1C46